MEQKHKGRAMKKAKLKKEDMLENLEEIQAIEEKLAGDLKKVEDMPDMIHGLISEVWYLKKELYLIKKEKYGYHRHMDEIEKNIVMMHKEKKSLAKENEKMKESIRNMIDFDIKKHPLKKYDAYKKLLALYLDMQRISNE